MDVTIIYKGGQSMTVTDVYRYWIEDGYLRIEFESASNRRLLYVNATEVFSVCDSEIFKRSVKGE